jgi:tetratricopeptide (TPR) repeat protein
MSLYGLGGCGKTSVALEFAYRMMARHSPFLVLWVPAISRETFEIAYREIGILLRIPGILDDNADVKQLVKNSLNSGDFRDWLMVIDNADDPSILLGSINDNPRVGRLYDYLPRSDWGSILFTTRSRKAAEHLTQSSILELEDMTKAEAKQLMAQRIVKGTLLDDQSATNELLELLTYLPLAIVQAIAFINRNEVSISDYVSLFKQVDTEVEILSECFEDPRRYRETESTIARTWQISFEQILKQDQLAADYLSFMSCVDRINIPHSLLPIEGTAVQRLKALGTLIGYVFITERKQDSQQVGGERFFNVHRLVQKATIWWLKEHYDWTAWIEKAYGWLEELVPYGGHEEKSKWISYLPHAIHVADLHSETGRVPLLDRIGRCQATLGQYVAAEETLRQALSIRRKSLGNEDALILGSMNQMELALNDQGKCEEMESMNRQMLVWRENVFGLEHPSTLMSMSNLALVLDSQGKYEEAESINKQTLAWREKVLGPEHADTLTSMSNLVLVLKRQGKHKEAESINGQMLVRREKALGPEYLNMLTSMSNLAEVLGRRGKYEEAELVNRQTLVRLEKVFGLEYPNTLKSMNNLAGVLGRRGKYKEAELMNRQALVRQEKILGPKHLDTLMSMSNLVSVLGCQGKYEEAESINRQTLAWSKEVLGPKHPDTLLSMNNLALVLGYQGKYEEAESVNRQTLAQMENVLGPEHPNTLMNKNNLVLVLGYQGKYKEAESINRQTLVWLEKVTGPEHPLTLTSMSNLALLLRHQDKHKEAESIIRQTLAQREKILGPEHPDTLMSVYYLAQVLANQLRYDESLALYKKACAMYSTVLGIDHPTTRACHEHYSEVFELQKHS